MSKDAWIVMIRTACQGEIPAWWTEGPEGSDIPVTYDTERGAQVEIAQLMIDRLQEFIDDEDIEDPEFETEDFVLPCTINDDGTITGEDGILWDPSEDQTIYGR